MGMGEDEGVNFGRVIGEVVVAVVAFIAAALV
jgi:hypothetical protein